jgi:hypothetical protein
MKLIVVGATGLVATEMIRQALLLPEITSIVAVSRNPIEHAETPRLKNVLLRDYGEYPVEAGEAFAGADACIWYACYRYTILSICRLPFLNALVKDCGHYTDAITQLRLCRSQAYLPGLYHGGAERHVRSWASENFYFRLL